LTNKTKASHGDTLRQMTYLLSTSFNCFFNSVSSEGDILYGTIEIGLVPSIKSIENSISLLGGKLGISLEKV